MAFLPVICLRRGRLPESGLEPPLKGNRAVLLTFPKPSLQAPDFRAHKFSLLQVIGHKPGNLVKLLFFLRLKLPMSLFQLVNRRRDICLRAARLLHTNQVIPKMLAQLAVSPGLCLPDIECIQKIPLTQAACQLCEKGLRILKLPALCLADNAKTFILLQKTPLDPVDGIPLMHLHHTCKIVRIVPRLPKLIFIEILRSCFLDSVQHCTDKRKNRTLPGFISAFYNVKPRMK